MKKISTDTLIIGAGPAGLACAMELSKAGKDFLIIEKQSTVGGLAKTREFREGDLVFRTDTGPHRFFSKNPYLYEFIEGIVGEQWIEVKRQTRQFIDGKFYDYPVNAVQALRNVGLLRALRMASDYAYAKFKYGLLKKPVANFYDYVCANFGRSLGEFNMINYTEKIWGISAKDIHMDWAGQRIKGLSLTSLLKDSLAKAFALKNAAKPKTLVDAFYYPELGTGLIYERIREELAKKGYRIMLETAPVSVNQTGGRITSVICRGPEGDIEIACQRLVESVPLKHFLGLLKPGPSAEILAAKQKLTYRNQAYLFLTLDKESVTRDQWIYFPNKEVPIGRMSEMKNFSARMSPPGKTSLFLEFFCSESDPVWHMSADELFEYAMPHLERIGFVRRPEVRHYYRLSETEVYPVYDVHYKEYLSKIKEYLDTFNNLFYIGRPGRFRYNNQDHSLEMGMLAAKSIIDGRRYDIEKVGEEKDYYESGALSAKKIRQ